MLEGSGGDVGDGSTNSTPTVEMIEEEPVNPDLIETVAFCKNIRNIQVLTEAIRGFHGTTVRVLCSALMFNYFFRTSIKLFCAGRMQTTAFSKQVSDC